VGEGDVAVQLHDFFNYVLRYLTAVFEYIQVARVRIYIGIMIWDRNLLRGGGGGSGECSHEKMLNI
jgi:hypothetical protein